MTKLTKAQKVAFMLMLARAREEWFVVTSDKTNLTKTTAIPLRNYYSCFNRNCREVILAAFDIFFERVTRGDSITKKSSLWQARSSSVVNELINPGTTEGYPMKKLTEIYHANKDNLVKIREHVYAKKVEGQPVTMLQVEFVWPDVETQQVFETIAIREWERNPQAQRKNTTTTS